VSQTDFYELLGVDRSADDATLKSSYRKLAMKFHPDRNPGDEEAEAKFKEISQAYDILSDPQKRSAYDQYGHAAFEGGGPGGGFDSGFTSSFADVFDDLFGEFVGGGRQRRTSGRRGDDLRYNLEVDFADAYNGKKVEIRLPTAANCDDCGGSGAEAGSSPVACPTCQGVGKVRQQSGLFTIERTCPKCGGAGRVIDNPCKGCGGVGRVQRDKALAVNVPPGVEDGTRIRLSGEGEAGVRGGPAGDLYIFLSVRPHPIYRREGEHLFCRVPIAMTTAALGGNVEVPTPDGGKATVKIPEGAQGGRQFRLRGKGMPHLRGNGLGDLYVEAVIETPVDLNKEQKELLRKFEEMGGGTSPESESFFQRVKEFLDGDD
jgi:molecular chaperone DnaJ